MDKLLSEFPETIPSLFKENHYRVLKILVETGEAYQSHLVTETGLSDVLMSKILANLEDLNFIVRNYSDRVKIVYLNKAKIGELNMLFARSELIKKSILLRPHKICLTGIAKIEGDALKKFVSLLTKEGYGYKYKLNLITNNDQHIFMTPYGTIYFYLHSNSFKVVIEEFLLPIKKEEIVDLEEHIIEGITTRFFGILRTIEPLMERCKICLKRSFRLGKMHLGMLTGEKIAKDIRSTGLAERCGLFVDKSVNGFKEVETTGTLNEVISRVADFINNHLDEDLKLTKAEAPDMIFTNAFDYDKERRGTATSTNILEETKHLEKIHTGLYD
jgi:DNA-binding MarR family transcriptional regulator